MHQLWSSDEQTCEAESRTSIHCRWKSYKQPGSVHNTSRVGQRLRRQAEKRRESKKTQTTGRRRRQEEIGFIIVDLPSNKQLIEGKVVFVVRVDDSLKYLLEMLYVKIAGF